MLYPNNKEQERQLLDFLQWDKLSGKIKEFILDIVPLKTDVYTKAQTYQKSEVYTKAETTTQINTALALTNYVDNAAATADEGLLVGKLYRVGTNVRIKVA